LLGENHRLREELLAHGKTAPAELLEFKSRPWSVKRPGELGAFSIYRMKLRVSPPGELPFEVEITDQWRADHLIYEPRVGERVSVLYSPEDHSKVVLGGPPLGGSAKGGTDMGSQASGGMDDELAQLAALDAEERQDSPPPPAAPAAGPGRLDQLQQLADLHERGVLNDDEFAAEKARILGG